MVRGGCLHSPPRSVDIPSIILGCILSSGKGRVDRYLVFWKVESKISGDL